MNPILYSKLLAILDEAFITSRMLLQIGHLAGAEKLLEDLACLPTILQQKHGWKKRLRDFVHFVMPQYLDPAYPDKAMQRTIEDFRNAYVAWAVRHGAFHFVLRQEGANGRSNSLCPEKKARGKKGKPGQGLTS